ncbi:MAG: CotH kinase family protein [Candidatus Sumerlaeaceae bacterium]|nr:CotH kinase family protein [Candidatus Sumerlaeaceae bacterium]
MKTSRLCLIFCVFLGTLSASAADIYVDNDSGSPGYTETGSWTTTSNIGAGYNSGSYRFTRSTSVFSTATWKPTISSTGWYSVYAIFRRGADRTSSAPYTINHALGSSPAFADQTGAFDGDLGEVLLGVYKFNAGNAGTVVMNNVTGGNVVFIADTIRFSPDPGPEVTQTRIAPLYPQNNQPFRALARVTDNGSLSQVIVNWSASPSGTTGTVTAFDDGFHDDGLAGDGTYGGSLPGFATGQTVTLSFTATDDHGAVTTGASVQAVIGMIPSYQIRINEILASNSGSSFDLDFGESGDWVELYNTGPDVADLTSHTLSDSFGTPEKWRFPAGTSIPAGGYLLVWCDDYNLAEYDLHSNFKLSASGEAVVLYDTNATTVVDSINFPALGSDETYSRIPNGTGAFAYTIVNTPLAANIFGARGAKPVFSMPSGLYSSTINVSISAVGATEIRYTTNGSEPTTTSSLYSVPISISSTTGLRAKAYYPSVNPSLPASASYFFDFIADRTIPVMNLIMDSNDLFNASTGIWANYNQRGDNWEKPGYAVIMNPDGSQVRESAVGVRINGGTSRAAAKKSLRLYLRANYGGTSWTLPWLVRTSAPSFTNLVLRGNNNDGILNSSLVQLNQVTFFRDEILRDWHGDSGAVAVDGFFFALYINGQYYGLYNACERVTDDYMASKAGGSDWDVMKGTWNSTLKYNTEAIDGDNIEWNSFLSWLNVNDLSTTTALATLKQKIDYPGFLKYFALNIAAQNEDWPQNNWIATHRRGDPTSKWTFHQNDGEWGLGLRPQGYASDTLTWAQGNNFMISPSHNGKIAPLCKLFNGNDWDPNPIPAVNGILDNVLGRKDFISAMEEILNFELSPAVSIPSVNSYAAKIQTEIPRESARWAANMIESAAAFNAGWPNAVNTMRTFLANRPNTVRSLMQTKFSIAGTRPITFQKSGGGSGKLQIYGRTVDLPWSGVFFDSSALNLAAAPDLGSSFLGWTGAITTSSAALTYTPTTGTTLTVTLNFGVASVTVQPNDVIFNEYWINDDSTSYPGIGLLHNDWLELLVVKNGTDLRGWRVTNNKTTGQQGAVDDGDGSLIFPNNPAISNLAAGTIILVVASTNTTNTATFPTDDLHASDKRLIFYRGNGNLDDLTDPGFGMGTSNEALILLAPGTSSSFSDDVGVDFIAEGSTVTPTSFFGVTSGTASFINPFSGIGGDDGAYFTNDSGGGFNNDNGADPNTSDALPGPGGWVVDPPGTQTGDSPPGGPNVLTPGAPNTGQNLTTLYNAAVRDWPLY